MLFTDYLYENSKEVWDKYLEHPFLIELGEGTLDKEKFRKYLIQDYLYLIEYAKVYAMACVKSRNMKDIKNMTLKEKVGQMIGLAFSGDKYSPELKMQVEDIDDWIFRVIIYISNRSKIKVKS